MNELDQRMALAEIEEWENVAPPGRLPVFKQKGYLELRDLPPDYLRDLNAMHRVEKILRAEQTVGYTNELRKVLRKPITENESSPIHGVWEWHATAAQRAEAILRTLRKWKD